MPMSSPSLRILWAAFLLRAPGFTTTTNASTEPEVAQIEYRQSVDLADLLAGGARLVLDVGLDGEPA